MTLLAVSAPRPAVGAADLTFWQLSTGVDDNSSGQSLTDGDFSITVQNPWTATLAGYLPDQAAPTHYSIANYNASWVVSSATGTFSLDYDQRLGGADARASINGLLFLQTDTDILFSLSATMIFASSAGDEADFLLKFLVYDEPFSTVFFGESQSGGDFHYGGPVTGTLAFSATDILLPGGGTYRISYKARSSSYIFPIQDPLTANGTIQFNWRPVPEPATATLCLIAAVPLLLYRHRRSGL